MPEYRRLTRDEEEVWFAYILFSRQLAAGMERQLAGSGVSGADYQMLAPLAAAGAGGMRARDLATVPAGTAAGLRINCDGWKNVGLSAGNRRTMMPAAFWFI